MVHIRIILERNDDPRDFIYTSEIFNSNFIHFSDNIFLIKNVLELINLHWHSNHVLARSLLDSTNRKTTAGDKKIKTN